MERWQFQDTVDRLGPDTGRWPDAERRAGETLLAADPSAVAILDEGRRLASLLASAPAVSAPVGLLDRIMAKATAAAPVLPEVTSPPTSLSGEEPSLQPLQEAARRPLRD